MEPPLRRVLTALPTTQDGILTTWNDDRGFGFITAASGSRFFVHISAFDHPALRPEQGDIVSFAPGVGADGRPRATRVNGVGGRSNRARPRPASVTYAWIVALAVGLIVAIVFGAAPVWLAAVYAVMSALTFALYAIDKSSARMRGQRTPESLLHTLELLGGWPGALLAQQWLRHKSAKQSYLQTFWVVVALNLAALIVVSLPWFWVWMRTI